MRCLIIALLLMLPSLHAEDWIDQSPRAAGAGGVSGFERGPLGAYYNPALTSPRPWETRKGRVQFDIATGLILGMYGNSHRNIFKMNAQFQKFRKQQKSGDYFHPQRGMQALQDVADVLHLFDQFDAYQVPKGDGFYGGATIGWASSIQSLWLPRDAVTVNISYDTFGAWTPKLDQDNYNFDVRLTNDTGMEWLRKLKDLHQFFGPVFPSTPEGHILEGELAGLGYPPEMASMIAWMAEQSGYDLTSTGPSRQLLLQSLYNNLYNQSPSLQDGADPFKGNKSGLKFRTVSWRSIAVSYSFAIPNMEDWLTIGLTARYMRAYRGSGFALANDISLKHFDVTRGQKDLQHNFGLDLGLTFTPPGMQGLSINFAGRNLNCPQFLWNDLKLVMPPQFRLGVDWRLSPDIPVQLGFEADLNRTESSLLPGLHHQYVRFGLALEPEWYYTAFAIRFGAKRNVAEPNEPWLMTVGLGARLWHFTFDVSMQTTFDSIYGIENLVGMQIPRRFGINASIGFKLDW